MNELKHTKGPWVTIDRKVQQKNFPYIIIADVKRMRAWDQNIYGIKDEVNEANAKLIASAPELLEALMEAKEALEWYMSNTTPDNKDWQSFHDTGMNAIQKAENAIKKATE